MMPRTDTATPAEQATRPRPYPQPPRPDRQAPYPDPVPVQTPHDVEDDDERQLFNWGQVLANLGRYFTPPAPWATPPASLEELASYAHVGQWAPSSGPRRLLGIAYWYSVGLPTTVICRYAEWVAQRPGRLVTVLALGAVLHRTTPGQWVTHSLGQVFHYLFMPLTWLY